MKLSPAPGLLPFSIAHCQPAAGVTAHAGLGLVLEARRAEALG